ncbi:MAG: hypothetical protein GX021_10125 [Tissierellia bacterium]|nr:hypothetical protein [Tissierellia bacterium]
MRLLSNVIKSFRVVEVESVDPIITDTSVDNKELEKILEDTLLKAKEEYESIIHDAKAESKKIIENAEVKYEEMINAAYTRAKEIMDQSKEEGYKEGYENGFSEGYDKGYKEGKEKSNILINEALEIKTHYLEKRNSLLKELEEDIIELVVSIYEKVINKRTEEDNELIVSLVLNGIKNLDLTDKLTIISSKEDYEILEMARQEILAKSSFISELEIKYDMSLEKGDCILETSKGSIDVSIKNQLEEVKELLTSILNNE